MEEDMEMFVWHVNVHQSITSAEEEFKNHTDRMTYYVNTTQPLSLATPVIAQWGHEQSSHSGRDEGYNWTQWYWTGSSCVCFGLPILQWIDYKESYSAEQGAEPTLPNGNWAMIAQDK